MQVQSRLAKFLPTIAEANRSLEVDRAKGELGARSIEKIEDGEPHIEMVNRILSFDRSSMADSCRI